MIENVLITCRVFFSVNYLEKSVKVGILSGYITAHF